MFGIELDPVLLARIQFAFTISFHIIFPAFTIGLASWLAVVEGLFLKTGKKIYEDIYKMWIKIFAVCFGMGVVFHPVVCRIGKCYGTWRNHKNDHEHISKLNFIRE